MSDLSPFSLLAALFLIVLFGYQSEKTRIGKQLSAPLIILLVSFILGNVGLLPTRSPTYSTIQSLLVPLAIPLLLFRANIRRAVTESGRLLLAFVLAVFFTIAGAIAGALLIDMGVAEGQLVGVLAASYIGGSANFVATAQAVGFDDSSLYTSALTADAIGAMVFLTILMLLPGLRFVQSRFPARKDPAQHSAHETQPDSPPSAPVTEYGVVLTLSATTVICSAGLFLSEYIPFEGAFIVIITLLSLIVANAAPKAFLDKLSFDYGLGTLFMYVFFATIGAGADISAMAQSAIPIVAFLLILVAVHIMLLVWIGALFKLELAELMIASSACILGPSAAAAIAAGRGWRDLITPGMLVGTMGYAIANFCGLALYAIFSP